MSANNDNNVLIQLAIAQHHHWHTTTILEKKLPDGSQMWLVQLHEEKQDKKDKKK